MRETQSGTAGAADTHTGAATGSLSGMEVRRRSSSLQRMTIQRRPEARHFRLWTMKGRARASIRRSARSHLHPRAPQESQSRPYSAAMTIDADRCPTCSGAQFVVLRGNQVPCPTCTPRGDSERHTFGRRRAVRKLRKGPATPRLTTMFLGGAVIAGVLALLSWFGFTK